MQVQPSITPTAGQTTNQNKPALEARARNGANWFFWISGLSLINTIIYLGGGNWSFIVGLGSSQLVDGIAMGLIQEYGPGYATILRLMALAIDIGLAGIFIVAGLLGRKNLRWAMITGMVLYFVDALIFILVGDWLGIIFHAMALVGLFTGLRAMNMLKRMATTEAIAFPTTSVTQETSIFRSDVFRILGGSCAAYIGILMILAIVGFILLR